MSSEEKPRVPFGIEHVKAVCRAPLLPEGDNDLLWGFRLNNLDLTSTHNYRWPFPGHWAEASGPFTTGLRDGDACPTREGDGLCIAKTITGAQSGSGRFGGSVGLLVAYLASDVLAETVHKVRVTRAWVADQFDPVRALVEASRCGANLRGATLSGATLSGADLYGANLYGANLYGANLYGATLRGANLYGADLYGATLYGATLSGANLYGATLRGATLRGADLRGADLSGADLYGANLSGADLSGATYSQGTLWPDGFDVSASGAVKW